MVCKVKNVSKISVPPKIILILKMMSSPTRYKILSSLKDRKRMHCEIVNMVDRAQPTVATHLNTLIKNKLIKKEVKNNKVYYALQPEIQKLMKTIEKCIMSNTARC
ncbi:winged helix-turn-helix transcriptional regulator [Candidatus Micrarchaeota archaeon]|nr:winged helix-turn-helix transcriptional regulator [Candidatus Micrarchaeota archaeon]